MTSHYATILGYSLATAAGIALGIRAHRPGSRIPTIGQLLARIMHDRTGRIAIIAWWAFIGLHLFSK